MHRLQKFILTELITHPRLRFSDLQPLHTEGSKLTYHLRQLQANNYIQQKDSYYSLTTKGKSFAEDFELSSLTTQQQPRTVVLVLCKYKQKGWLLSKRLTHPSLHMVGFPKVRVELGKNLLTASQLEFKRVSGLSASLSYAGNAYVTQFNSDNSLESCVHIHLLVASHLEGNLQNNDESAEMFWLKDPDWTSPDIIPSVPDLIEFADSSQSFTELTYYL